MKRQRKGRGRRTRTRKRRTSKPFESKAKATMVPTTRIVPVRCVATEDSRNRFTGQPHSALCYPPPLATYSPEHSRDGARRRRGRGGAPSLGSRAVVHCGSCGRVRRSAAAGIFDDYDWPIICDGSALQIALTILISQSFLPILIGESVVTVLIGQSSGALEAHKQHRVVRGGSHLLAPPSA